MPEDRKINDPELAKWLEDSRTRREAKLAQKTEIGKPGKEPIKDFEKGDIPFESTTPSPERSIKDSQAAIRESVQSIREKLREAEEAIAQMNQSAEQIKPASETDPQK